MSSGDWTMPFEAALLVPRKHWHTVTYQAATLELERPPALFLAREYLTKAYTFAVVSSVTAYRMQTGIWPRRKVNGEKTFS